MKTTNIKKDLINIYNDLYPLVKMEGAEKFFSSNTIKRFKYTPEEIEEALNSDKNKYPKKDNTIKSEIIEEIQTLDQVRDFFNNNLLLICQSHISDVEKQIALRKYSLEEIKHLYSIVFNITLPKKCKKIDIIYSLKKYFDNEKRTADLIKIL